MPRRAAAPRFVTGRVADGRVVTSAKLPAGAKVGIQEEPSEPVEIDAETEAAIARGLADIRAGRRIPLAEFRAKLRRL